MQSMHAGHWATGAVRINSLQLLKTLPTAKPRSLVPEFSIALCTIGQGCVSFVGCMAVDSTPPAEHTLMPAVSLGTWQSLVLIVAQTLRRIEPKGGDKGTQGAHRQTNGNHLVTTPMHRKCGKCEDDADNACDKCFHAIKQFLGNQRVIGLNTSRRPALLDSLCSIPGLLHCSTCGTGSLRCYCCLQAVAAGRAKHGAGSSFCAASRAKNHLGWRD